MGCELCGSEVGVVEQWQLAQVGSHNNRYMSPSVAIIGTYTICTRCREAVVLRVHRAACEEIDEPRTTQVP